MNKETDLINSRTLKSFLSYCRKNPDLRFWQAVRGWSRYSFVLVADEIGFLSKREFTGIIDTYYFIGKIE